MSAFVVPKEHVAALIKWFMRSREYQWEFDRGTEHWETQKAAMLYAENVRSVNHRYQNETPEEPIAFTWSEIDRAPKLLPVQVIKACQCLEYQSCETEDWKETPSKKLLDRIKNAAIHALPGYEEAAWSIDSEVAK